MRDPVLIGAEQAERASLRMKEAADRMYHAAELIASNIDRLDGIVVRLENVVRDFDEAILEPEGADRCLPSH